MPGHFAIASPATMSVVGTLASAVLPTAGFLATPLPTTFGPHLKKSVVVEPLGKLAAPQSAVVKHTATDSAGESRNILDLEVTPVELKSWAGFFRNGTEEAAVQVFYDQLLTNFRNAYYDIRQCPEWSEAQKKIRHILSGEREPWAALKSRPLGARQKSLADYFSATSALIKEQVEPYKNKTSDRPPAALNTKFIMKNLKKMTLAAWEKNGYRPSVLECIRAYSHAFERHVDMLRDEFTLAENLELWKTSDHTAQKESFLRSSQFFVNAFEATNLKILRDNIMELHSKAGPLDPSKSFIKKPVMFSKIVHVTPPEAPYFHATGSGLENDRLMELIQLALPRTVALGLNPVAQTQIETDEYRLEGYTTLSRDKPNQFIYTDKASGARYSLRRIDHYLGGDYSFLYTQLDCPHIAKIYKLFSNVEKDLIEEGRFHHCLWAVEEAPKERSGGWKMYSEKAGVFRAGIIALRAFANKCIFLNDFRPALISPVEVGGKPVYKVVDYGHSQIFTGDLTNADYAQTLAYSAHVPDIPKRVKVGIRSNLLQFMDNAEFYLSKKAIANPDWQEFKKMCYDTPEGELPDFDKLLNAKWFDKYKEMEKNATLPIVKSTEQSN